MRSVYLLLVLLIAVCATKASAVESCPEANCVSADHCHAPWQGMVECEGTGKVCCSLLKTEYRTKCEHHGAECMSWCNEVLRRNVIDECPSGEMCCVLV